MNFKINNRENIEKFKKRKKKCFARMMNSERYNCSVFQRKTKTNQWRKRKKNKCEEGRAVKPLNK